jgi:endonuclease/exonuclease/phosphatase family metal-dependent hydrolase
METGTPGPHLRVLTLNLWNLNGPVERRMAALARALASSPVDVLALQEVSVLDGRTQAAWIAGQAGLPHVHYDPTWIGEDREEGLALVTRAPLRPLPPTRLPIDRRDGPRLLQRADLDLPQGTVRLANTHLAWRRRHTAVRTRQVARIRDALSGVASPVVLTGDLNDRPGSPPLELLQAPPPAGAGLRDAYRAGAVAERPTLSRRNPWTWQWWLTDRRVDHVLVSPEVEVVDAAVTFDGATGPVVSDHYGILTTLALPA